MFFWNSLDFLMIQWMLAIWSLVPLPFLKPAWTSGSSRFTHCWNLTWRILSITLLACEMSAIVGYFKNSLALPFFGIGMKTEVLDNSWTYIWDIREWTVFSMGQKPGSGPGSYWQRKRRKIADMKHRANRSKNWRAKTQFWSHWLRPGSSLTWS